MRTLILLIALFASLPAADGGSPDAEEWISIPKSFLRHLDIPLVDNELQPSQELRDLLMLSPAEAEAMRTALTASRDAFLAAMVERCTIVTAELDHLEIQVPDMSEPGTVISQQLRELLLAAIGEPRLELLDLVRHDQWGDRLAESLYGQAYNRDLSRRVTITLKQVDGMDQQWAWQRQYQARSEAGGTSSSSSTSEEMPAVETRLFKAVLARAAAEGAAGQVP